MNYYKMDSDVYNLRKAIIMNIILQVYISVKIYGRKMAIIRFPFCLRVRKFDFFYSQFKYYLLIFYLKKIK